MRIIRKIQNKKDEHKKIGFTKYLLAGILIVLVVSSIFMTVETATSGVEMTGLQKEEAELASQKRSLEDSLVKSLSVSTLQTQSQNLGFVKPVSLVYVAPAEAVAKLP